MPRRSESREVARATNGRGVVVSGTGERIALNATALALLELCDGATAIEEMTAAVAILFDLPLDRTELEVVEALTLMAAAGLIQ